MADIAWLTRATSSPMGQQRYETRIQQAIARQESAHDFRTVRVTSLRSGLPADHRLPLRVAERAPAWISSAMSLAATRRCDLVHRFDLRLPPGRPLRPEVVTIHDLPPLRFADEGDLPDGALASARRADHIIVPSSFAAAEIRELTRTSTPITVVPYGLDDVFAESAPALDEELTRLGVTSRFVVHAAGASERKNLAALAEAWRRLSGEIPDVQLLLLGPPDPRRSQLFEGLDRVVLGGRLEFEAVARVMKRAAAVVVPSTYEGFGLPTLEGMACGVPVVAANRSAIPEVAGDAALLVEPEGESIAEGLGRVLTDDHLSETLRAAGPQRARTFSWHKAAGAHLAVYEEVLGGALS